MLANRTRVIVRMATTRRPNAQPLAGWIIARNRLGTSLIDSGGRYLVAIEGENSEGRLVVLASPDDMIIHDDQSEPMPRDLDSLERRGPNYGESERERELRHHDTRMEIIDAISQMDNDDAADLLRSIADNITQEVTT
jgi:hypothetical protein